MQQFFDSISNRELSVFIWAGIILTYLLLNPGVRKSFWRALKQLFGTSIVFLLLIYILIILSIVFLAYRLGYWDLSLLKDTLLWFVTVACVLFIKSNNIKDTTFFKNLFLESFKLIILVEFIINFYDFSLPVELFLVPFVLVVALTQAYAEIYADKKPDHKQVSNSLKTVLGFMGLAAVLYSLYKTIVEYTALFTLANLKSLLLPPVFTVSLFPVLYLFALYMNYEILFVRINGLYKDASTKKRLKS